MRPTRGRLEPAEEHYLRAISLARSSGATFVVGIDTVGLLTLRANDGRVHDALLGYRDVIGYWARAGNWTHQWVSLRNLARLLRQIGDHEPAGLLDAADDQAPDAPAVGGPPPTAPQRPTAGPQQGARAGGGTGGDHAAPSKRTSPGAGNRLGVKNGAVSELASIESRLSRNTNDIEALYGLIEEFAGRTRVSFAKVNQRLDDLEGRFDSLESRFDGLEGKVDGVAGQLGEVLELLRKQS